MIERRSHANQSRFRAPLSAPPKVVLHRRTQRKPEKSLHEWRAMDVLRSFHEGLIAAKGRLHGAPPMTQEPVEEREGLSEAFQREVGGGLSRP